MVHILLTILKITGIVLLALLVLLLLLLASILFVPVRYSGRIRKQDKGFEKMEIRGSVSWLLRAVSLSGAYENGQFSGRLRIFGISVRTFGQAKRKAASGAAVGRTPEVKDSGRSETAGRIPSEGEDGRQSKGADRTSPEGENNRRFKGTGRMPLEEEDSKMSEARESRASGMEPEKAAERFSDISSEQPSAGTGELPWEKAVRFLEWIAKGTGAFFRFLFRTIGKIFGIPRRAAKAAERLRKKLRKLRASCAQWKRFLTSERFREGMKLLLAEAGRLLREIRPRKIKGDLVFGFDDPALTGQVLGAVSLFPAAFAGEFRVTPVFEQEILRMHLDLAGRIYGITLVRVFWRLFRDRNIRFIYRKLAAAK